MATILQVMEGIEARLATIEGLQYSEYVPDQVNPPHAFVGVPEIPDYDETFGRGVYRVAPTITVLTSAALDRVGQRALAEFANPSGTKSIPAAIDADRTLGSVVDDCKVTGFRPLNVEEVGVIGYYGGEFQLDVLARV